MTDREAAALLGPEWEMDGHFGRLRTGIFSAEGHARILAILRAVEKPADGWDAAFISLAWFIPTFMAWQAERCVGLGTDAAQYERATGEASDVLLDLLGAP